jgi:serine/threonine protein phosphatase PrpC
MPGEWILLCSDGFHQVFSGTALVNLLRETAWPLQAKTAQRWCQLAMQAGAQDDVTVIVIEPTTTVTSRGYSWFWTVVSLTVIFAVLWKFK